MDKSDILLMVLAAAEGAPVTPVQLQNRFFSSGNRGSQKRLVITTISNRMTTDHSTPQSIAMQNLLNPKDSLSVLPPPEEIGPKHESAQTA